uniref:hypothetical protein n=1 Tax=Echinothamnion hookeri TaxID=2008680 RepID=UPI002551EC79|nr:hypothetical protein QQP88_pgp008 [Echinothamnion hookeri]WGH14398.1 hypothetical protein [Echinothamnion hookeri]
MMINKKIDLLIISLETLNIYFIKNQNILELNRLHQDLGKHTFSTNHKFIKLIKKIYIIQLIIDKYLLNEIANEVLKNYTKSKKCNFINKYRKKFYKTYCEKKEYYKNYKLLHSENQIDIHNIALINLYIISKSVKKDGTYFLIKYLLNSV